MSQAEVLDPLEDPSVSGYLTDWLSHTRTRVRPTTYEGYEYLVRCHLVPGLGHIRLTDLHPLHIHRLYSSLLEPAARLSSGTVLNLHLVLTQALSQAVRWGIVPTNPAKGAQPPRPDRPEPVVVDRSLASRIVSELKGTSLVLPAMIATSTGMRSDEMLGL